MKLIKYFLILLFCFLITNLNAKENFFQDAKSKYDEKELEESKFLFQRNIVFNPKHAKSLRTPSKESGLSYLSGALLTYALRSPVGCR